MGEGTPDPSPPEASIDNPQVGYFYFKDTKLWPSSGKTIIWSIGGFTVEVRAIDHESGIHRVEFFVDDETKPREVEYRQTPEQKIFSWHWDETMFGEEHTVKVAAYDLAGNTATDELTVTVFNLHLWSPP
jgi:hypothetical protein